MAATKFEMNFVLSGPSPSGARACLARLLLGFASCLMRWKLEEAPPKRKPLPGDNVEPNRRLLESESTYRGTPVAKPEPRKFAPICRKCGSTIYGAVVHGNTTGRPYHESCLIPECRA